MMFVPVFCQDEHHARTHEHAIGTHAAKRAVQPARRRVGGMRYAAR